MKTNQKALSVLAIALSLFSCTSNEAVSSSPNASAVASTYEIVSAAALPTTITSYITTKYARSTTTEVNLNADGSYVTYVTLAAGAKAKTSSVATTSNVTVKLIFSAKGVLVSTKVVSPVAIADLLPAITTYISANYAGATIIAAHSESDGSFDVLITAADGSKIKLNFGATGTFISATINKADGNHNHSHSNNQTPIAIANLATSITTYISTTYADATITSAHKESDGSFDVFITTAAGANLNLNFSAAGDFVAVSCGANNHSNHETPIAVADLLASITTYISTNFPGATITSAEKDWNGGFEVHITTATGIKLELNFTAEGVFTVGSNFNNHHTGGPVIVIAQDLIATIKTYITTNYAGSTIKEAHLESDGSYDIFIITVDGTKLKLNFSATGVFVSVKTV